MKKLICIFMMFGMAALFGCSGSGSDGTQSAEEDVIKWDILATPIAANGHVIEAPLVDFLPDGRMVIADGNSATEIEIAIETANGSKTFNYITSIIPETSNSFASFVKTVDSDTIIIGASTHIYRVELATGDKTIIAETGNFDAVISDGKLYFTRTTYNPDWSANTFVSSIALNNPVDITDIIKDIPGASAGVCLDYKGNIYTGNGYSNSGISNETGLIKRFTITGESQEWSAGIPVATILSATPLIYAGNDIILTGGGDLFGTGDANYFAAVDASTGDVLFKLDPDSSADSYYKLSAGNGRFAACIWDYTNSAGTIYLIPFEALGL